MQRIKHNLIQGSAQWHAFRATHFGASEASAMLGISPYKTRDELLAEKKTGLTKEVNATTQKIFDKGHAVEKLALPIAEKLTGVELSPVTMSFGNLSASCDGLDFEDEVAWENKQFNQAHYEQVLRGELPEIHWPQCQQVLYVTGAKKLFFTISDGTEEKTAGVWVYPELFLFKKITAGWEQFERDLETFTPAESKAMPKAEVIVALPALFINAKAEITATNMAEYGEALKSRLAEVRSIVLVDDQDFANAKAGAKQLREGMDQAKQALQAMTAQNTSFDEAKRMIESWIEDMRLTALKLEKDVEAEDKKKKAKMIEDAQEQYQKHLEDLAEGTLPIRIPNARPDFAGAMKNKKNYDSMQSAINGLLAQAKAEANEVDMAIRAKQTWMKQFAEYELLFPDMQTIIFKAMDDFKLLVQSRIDTYKAKDAEIKAKGEAAAQAEAERLANAKTQSVPTLATRSGLTALPPAIEQEFGKQFVEGLDDELNPTRLQLVAAVAFFYKVKDTQAEAWLINRFGAMEKAA